MITKAATTKKPVGVKCGDCDMVSTGKMICPVCADARSEDDDDGWCDHGTPAEAVRSWAQRKWTLGAITNERRDFLNEVADDMEGE